MINLQKNVFARQAIAAVIFWVLLAFIFSATYHLQAVRAGQTPEYLSILKSYFIVYGSTALLAPAVFAVGRRQAALKPPWLHQARVILVTVIVIFSVHILYSIVAIAPYQGVTAAEFFKRTWFAGWVWDLVLLAAVLLGGYAFGYSEKIRDAKIAQAELKGQLATIEAELANEQSNHLRQRLGSHFVLNALSNIIALVRKSENEKAMDGLYLLSEILRSIAHQNDDNLCTLDQEITFLSKYLEFQKIRYPALKVSWAIDTNTRQALLPEHIIQPLAENAFKHGMDSTGSLNLKIAAKQTAKGVRIAVSNSFGTKPNLERRGEGQTLTELRLQKHYGTDASFSWSIDDKCYDACIDIPQQMGAQ